MTNSKHVCFTVAILAIVAVPATAQLDGGALYGSTGAVGGMLIEVDPATGASTDVGPINDFGPVTEIEFRADEVLFGSTGGGSSNIIVIDPLTGDETLVGQHAFGAVNGLEFVGDTLYGSFFAPAAESAGPEAPEGAPTYLVTVDQTDGSLTTIGQMDHSPVRGLAWDEATGTMYGVAPPGVVVLGPEGVSDVLVTVDLATGATAEVGFLGHAAGALEFGPDGILYAGEIALEGDRAAPEGTGTMDNLLVVDPATGAATPVGPTGRPRIRVAG